MSFKIEDDNVLVKYNEIWHRMLWWNRMSVYDRKYIKDIIYDRDITDIRTR